MQGGGFTKAGQFNLHLAQLTKGFLDRAAIAPGRRSKAVATSSGVSDGVLNAYDTVDRLGQPGGVVGGVTRR